MDLKKLAIPTLTILQSSAVVGMLYHLMRRQEQSTLMREQKWDREREKLLNRLMTKEWTSYVQMEQYQNPNLTSTSDESRGLSDEEELRRWAQSAADIPVGETLVDLQAEFRELGIESQ